MEGLFFKIGTGLLRTAYGLAAFINPKARAFRDGRRHQADGLRKTFPQASAEPLVWFHCASLGEFEQGRPVMEALKSARPGVRILLTFFSPSGYEVRMNYALADHVFYLPWDTTANAEWFASQVRPAIAVFVKYEFWYHYARALRQHGIPLISISAIFRPSHVYFKSRGFAFRGILRNFSHFFVQNEPSRQLLHSIGITDVTLAGDTRFDRVAEVAAQAGDNAVARAFSDKRKVMVIGSAWPEDMEVLLPFMNERRQDLRFIVAPHEISDDFMKSIEQSFRGRTARYSSTTERDATNAELLIIDTIGLLAHLYRYGAYAFVGGGFRQGLHNILEGACYGIPVFFGNRAPYDKYQEAVDLVARGGAFAVADTAELDSAFSRLSASPDAYRKSAEECRAYVQQNRGATKKIISYILQTLDTWKAA